MCAVPASDATVPATTAARRRGSAHAPARSVPPDPQHPRVRHRDQPHRDAADSATHGRSKKNSVGDDRRDVRPEVQQRGLAVAAGRSRQPVEQQPSARRRRPASRGSSTPARRARAAAGTVTSGEPPVALGDHLRVEEQVPGREREAGDERRPGRRPRDAARRAERRVGHHRPGQRDDHTARRARRAEPGRVDVVAERQRRCARPSASTASPPPTAMTHEAERPRQRRATTQRVS